MTSAETLIQQTSDTMLLKVSELQDEIGIPFKVKNWEQGSLSTSDGSEITATNYIRSEFIDVSRVISILLNEEMGHQLRFTITFMVSLYPMWTMCQLPSSMSRS